MGRGDLIMYCLQRGLQTMSHIKSTKVTFFFLKPLDNL